MTFGILPLIIFALLDLFHAFEDPFLRKLPDITYAAPDRRPYGVGKASTYGRKKDDIKHRKKYGKQSKQTLMACAPTYRVDDSMHVCAHRKLPCGTVLLLEHDVTKQTTMCKVTDRGPYGCIDPKTGKWANYAKLKKIDPERAKACALKFRGELDVSPAVRAELAPGDGGLQDVRFWVIKKPFKKTRRSARARKPTS